MDTHILDATFKKLGRKNPAAKYQNVFKNPENRNEVVDFLDEKLQDFIRNEDWYLDNKLEWNIIHSIRIAGEIRAEQCIDALIRIMNMVIEMEDSYICNATASALENLADPAFEKLYSQYMKTQSNDDSNEIWLSILAASKRKDKRLRDLLTEHFKTDPVWAIHFMVQTEDRFFVPQIKAFVETAAASINRRGINPFEMGVRFEYPEVDDYINTREELILLETGYQPLSEEFDKAVEDLDTRLIKNIDPSVIRKKRELINEIKSLKGADIERHFFRITEMALRQTLAEGHTQVHLGRIVAILIAAHTHPEILSFSIIYRKIFAFFKLNTGNENLVRQFNNTIMELWNHLLDSQPPEEYAFLDIKGVSSIRDYIEERCDELRDYLGTLLCHGKLDKLKYATDSQKSIEYFQSALSVWEKLHRAPDQIVTLEDFAKTQVLFLWELINVLKSLETLKREERISKGESAPGASFSAPGRNDPCPCGSGKKYKHCCMN